MGSLNDKVRAARRAATKLSVGNAADKTIQRNSETAGVKLSLGEKRTAREVLVPRIKVDRERTAARGMAIEKMQEKKAAAKRMAAAIGNAPAAKKAAPKTTPKKTTKK
jgi:signal recognition particle subunit SEC65